MLTVPAQSFCAPARAKLMAALRSMPGVCAVFGSSEWHGITHTPSCFHFGSAISQLLRSLSPSGRAREAARLFGGAEQSLGLVDAFLLLGFRIGIRDDAGAGLDVHRAVLDQRGAQHDGGVHPASGGEIADRAGIEPALLLLQLVDNFHGAYLGRAGNGAGRKAGGERIDGVMRIGEGALDI